ncbi:esterase-like activity of phytase family protein [Rhizobiales bacterium]|uniref:esterase-like activity of phytase family protein n=1 Tax=Hongsoonwoonella zoysiae TaxID=2821844 RepID=UPI00156016C3|nr:esterase-like activity of phytase family protein [Hongsoonwoonella zoysiae]NRG17036.1 esterase-like activity of phytase family protein [Hongsoonwoonella zoysiae]
MRRKTPSGLAALICAALFLAAPPFAAPPFTAPLSAAPDLPRGKVIIDTKPIPYFGIGEANRDRFGKLEFLGGLELLPRNRHVGGLSGLAVADDGASFIAVTDNGLWVTGGIRQDAAGRPLGLRPVEVAPILGSDGTPLVLAGRGDTEAVAIDRSGEAPRLLVSAEGHHSIYAFGYPLDTSERAHSIPVPKAVTRLRANKGLEAVAVSSPDGPLGGTIVAIAERGASFDDDMQGFLIGGAVSGAFTVRRHDDFDVTDAAFLDDGDLLLLERRFNLRHGIGMRIRRIDGDKLKPGAVIDGVTIIEAGFAHQIDNMEALAVHTSASGDTILTILSDDNRSILQRSLLLRFRLADR